jgi:predicted lipase
MSSAIFSVEEAIDLGRHVLAAYDLFITDDPADFTPPDDYGLVTKVYADDITDGVPDYQVFGYVAQKGSDVIVAIRGAQGVLEWIMSAMFSPVTFPFLHAGRTEQGFTNFYSTLRTGPDASEPRVIDAIRSLVSGRTMNTLRITAHSLGAALATMLAIDVAANAVFATPMVYTFGSPKVGDKQFAGTYDTLVPTSWRIANRNDVVPLLPLFSGYVHVDAEIPINSDDRTRPTIPCWHALLTYLNTLDTSVPLGSDCAP